MAKKPVVAADCEPIGYLEIADLLDVAPVTVRQWKWKEQMPEPDFESIHGMPAWQRDTIIEWAGRTGKLRAPALIERYTKVTGREPLRYRKGGRLPAVEG
jgi:hypothetical protein